MAETNAAQAPGVADLERWAGPPNNLTFPVLSDPQWGVSNRYEVDNYIPSYSLIGRDMELLILDGAVNDAQISAALDEPIPEVAWNEPPELTGGGGEDGGGDNATAQSSPFGGGSAGLDDSGFISPYGGASCTASVAPGSSWLAVLLIGLVGVLRRR